MITSYKSKICIVNGDDFGASAGINRGIVEAFTNGILTSASLMINMPGAEEAIALGASYPDLSVGLHVNFTNEGDPVIDVNDVDAAQRELQRQYRVFTDRMGRPPTHIDSHHNIHRKKELTTIFQEFTQQHGLLMREYSPVRYFSGFYGQWNGESHPEHISAARLIHVLETEVTVGFTELACHPGYVSADFKSEYNVEREVELESLCDPLVQQRVEELGIELINYAQVRDLLNLRSAGSPES